MTAARYHSPQPGANPATPVLEVESLCIRFGAAEAVRGVSLSLAPGEVLGLVGESGSGKSATSLAILGLLGPAATVEGSIRWRGRELLGLSNRELRTIRGREIAMIFQEPMTALNPVMSIGRQVAEAIVAHQPRLGGKAARRQAIEALEAVAIPDAARRFGDYPHQFSGGQRQRILIAMALVHKPQLLIADEPTTALDVTVQAQVLELMKTLQRERGLAMLFTSHDLAVVGQMADRVAVMRTGQVVETGPARQVLTQPQHSYTQSLLAAVPTLRTHREKPLAMISGLSNVMRAPQMAQLLVEVEAGKHEGLTCPDCHKADVSAWFTNPADGEYRTWLFCASCRFETRAQNSGKPAFFTEERRRMDLEAQDAAVLKTAVFKNPG